MMNIVKEISTVAELNNLIITITKNNKKQNINYEYIELTFSNVIHSKKFYDAISKCKTTYYSVTFRFTGYFDENQKYPSGIEELNLHFDVIPCVTKTIDSICSLTLLTKLSLNGYVSYNMSDINKILTFCDKIKYLYVSYIDKDIENTITPHKNVKEFISTSFNNDHMNNNKYTKIDIYSFFPELEILEIYMGENYDLKNINLLKSLKDLTLKYHDIDNESLNDIEKIYPQLSRANIMMEPRGKIRGSSFRKGCERFPLID